MSGAAAVLKSSAGQSAGRSTRYEANAATREPAWVKWSILGVSLAFFAVFLLMPLVAVFVEAFRKGWDTYLAALIEPDALSAIKLTLTAALIAVPLNLVFGVAAAWAITKFEFRGKHLLITFIDLPFSVSPVVAGLCLVLLFGANTTLGGWLVSIDLRLTPRNGHPPAVLALNVDLIDMVRRQRLQVASAPDTPAAIIGLASFGSLWLRALFQTHFWSLRGQDYDRLQTGAPAEHGPLYPTLPGPACQPEVTRLPVPRYAPAAQVAGASAETLTLEEMERNVWGVSLPNDEEPRPGIGYGAKSAGGRDA